MKKKRRYGFPFRKKANRKYKDRLFRFVFSKKEDLLQLYNAVNGTDYQDSDMLEINTLEDVLYLAMKNDLSFILGSSINLYEHQSTWNPNMPLRGLLYLSKLYEKYVNEHGFRLSGNTRIPLPAPNYIVFYNGLDKDTERTELLLSDAFSIQRSDVMPCLECRATILNINAGHNQEIMDKCQRLREYAEFIEEIRQKLQEGLDLEHAVEEAMKYCIECGILADVLSKCRMEVRSMLLEEYDEKAEREYLRKEAIEEGRKEGIELGIEQGIEQGTKLLIKNVLDSTHSISQTALLLKLPKEEIEKTAREYGLHTKDI